MRTLDLMKSNDNLVVHGKLIVYLSTNTSTPITNPGPSQSGSSNRLSVTTGESTPSLSPSTATSIIAGGESPGGAAGSSSGTPVAVTGNASLPTPQGVSTANGMWPSGVQISLADEPVFLLLVPRHAK